MSLVEQKDQYIKTREELLKKREELMSQLREVEISIERLHGAVIALTEAISNSEKEK